MKIAFFLQRNFAPVGDALAASLKEKFPNMEFCAYVQDRNAHRAVTQTNAVTYSSMLLDEEILSEYKNEKLDIPYLRSLEEKYGVPNLWPYLTVDRVLMHGQLIREYPYDRPQYTHEELLRMMQVMARSIERFLDTEKPDHLVSLIIGSLGSTLLFHISRAKGVKTHIICPALFGNRFLFSEMHNSMSLRQELGSDFNVQASAKALAEAETFLRNFRERPSPPNAVQDPKLQHVTRRKQLAFLSPSKIGKSVAALVREYRRYWSNPHRDDYATVNPNHFLIDRIKRKMRNIRGISDLCDSPQKGDDYAFFPLHYEPEIALSVWAPGIGNQIDAVRRAAEALPVGWKLYVKEHPQMAGYRPRAFYKEIKKMPNVKLIEPRISSFDLIKDSGMCILITSTVGFEATLLGKPVVTLGNHLINDLSFVRYCNNLRELPNVVAQQINSGNYSDKELIEFLAKIIENSAVIDLMALWLVKNTPDELRRGISPLTELLAKRIG